MRCLLFLFLSSAAYCQPGEDEPSEDEVMENIHCSVYEYKKILTDIDVQPSKKAFLKNPNIITLDGKPERSKSKMKCDKCTKDLGCFNCDTYGLGRLPDFKMAAVFRAYTR